MKEKVNYSQMSSFDLNKLAAKKRFSHLPGLEVARDVEKRDRVVVFAEKEGELVSIACVDYCNEWRDCGEILEQSGISLVQLQNGDWCSVSRYEGDSTEPRASCTHKNAKCAVVVAYVSGY